VRELRRCVLKNLFAPLHSIGFKGRGGTVEAANGDLQAFVEVQSWPGFDSATYKFTVNVAIGAEELAHRAPQFFFSGLDIGTCPLRRRIGNFLAEPEDKWWIVRSPQECQDVCQKVLHLIQRNVLPWFQRIRTLGDLAAELRSHPEGNAWPDHIENWLADLCEGKAVGDLPPLLSPQ
jgi:hypothetical protein